MDISTIRDYRDALEEKIRKMVYKFEQDCGCKIVGVEVCDEPEQVSPCVCIHVDIG